MHDLNVQLNTVPKSELIGRSTGICGMLQEVHQRPTSDVNRTPVPSDFISEVGSSLREARCVRCSLRYSARFACIFKRVLVNLMLVVVDGPTQNTSAFLWTSVTSARFPVPPPVRWRVLSQCSPASKTILSMTILNGMSQTIVMAVKSLELPASGHLAPFSRS
jgi:hypothetical protein